MSRTRLSWLSRTILLGVVLGVIAVGAMSQGKAGWRSSFPVNKANLADTGRNSYFTLEPGYRLRFAHGKDTLTITVLDETKVVDGVNTRVVEEKETKNGQLAEISRNFFAIDKVSQNVFYFGRDVDIYKNGRVIGHAGTWRAGVKGARFGLMMSGKPKVGDKYYQELAPKVAMDRAEIISMTEEFKVLPGIFRDCLHIRESSDLESRSEDKWFAPGVGMIKDANFVLVEIEKRKP